VEVPTDADLRRFAAGGKPVREVLSPDGRQTISWADLKSLRLRDTASGEELRRFRGHTARRPDLHLFSGDGNSVATFSPDGKRALECYEIKHTGLALVNSLAEKAEVIARLGITVNADDQDKLLMHVPERERSRSSAMVATTTARRGSGSTSPRQAGLWRPH
jgi:hypothetical protein